MAVLNTHPQFPGLTLADLCDPLTIPPALRNEHQMLDAAYGRKNFKTDAVRVAFLFELYQRYTSLLPPNTPKRARRPAVKASPQGA